MKERTKEKLFVGLTGLKLAQGIDYARRVKTGKSIVGASIGIAVADIMDGLAPRRLGIDSPARRAADSATDAGIIAAGLISTYQKHPEARRYVVALAAREVFVAAGWAIDLAKSRQVKQGDVFHKLPSMAAWAFGLAAHHGSERTMKNTGKVALAVNAALAWDYFKGWTKPEERTTKLDTGVVEVAGFYDARKAMRKLGDSLPQLGPGNSQTPQLEAGLPAMELTEFNGDGEIPPGMFREIPTAEAGES